MKLIISNKRNSHVSYDTVLEFEKSIQLDNSVEPISSKNKYLKKITYFLYIIIRKLKINISLNLIGNKNSKLDMAVNPIFCVLMNLDIYKCLPWFLSAKHKNIYLFDTWPQYISKIKHFVNFFNIDYVFVPSSQAVELLRPQLNKSNIYWIPEGINPEEYKHYDYKDKNIDVLAFGRNYEKYHKLIVDYLKDKGKVYLYQKAEGEIIFPMREEFIDGLGKSKISICFPASITHPANSGEQEKMSIRFLQSIASKCLLLGHSPKEMIDLFGYNPVVEIDMKDPVRQLNDILNNFHDYIPLIEKNYKILIQHHTWVCRWNQIKEIMNKK